MLGLPHTTEINKALPKKAIYAKFGFKSAQRDHFDEDISKMAIVNAISPTTIPAVQKGETVDCIYVVEVLLKRKYYDPKNILLLSKLIPQKILFALRFEDEIQTVIYHTKLILGNWQKEDGACLTLQGNNLDSIWNNIVATTGEIVINEGNTLEQQIAIDDETARRLKAIADLEHKARAEKQPRKRLEMFEEIKKLKNIKV